MPNDNKAKTYNRNVQKTNPIHHKNGYSHTRQTIKPEPDRLKANDTKLKGVNLVQAKPAQSQWPEMISG
jgi:hypothetical protein